MLSSPVDDNVTFELGHESVQDSRSDPSWLYFMRSRRVLVGPLQEVNMIETVAVLLVPVTEDIATTE